MDVNTTLNLERLLNRGGLTPWSIPEHKAFIDAEVARLNVTTPGAGDEIKNMYEDLEVKFLARMEKKNANDSARIDRQKEEGAQKVVVLHSTTAKPETAEVEKPKKEVKRGRPSKKSTPKS